MPDETETPTGFWKALFSWEHIDTLLKILGLIAAIFVLRWLLLFIVRRLVNRVVHGIKSSHGVKDTQALIASPVAAMRMVQRTRTLGSVFGNFITVALISVGLILTLDLLGFSVTALIASAGVIGAALAFGAQNVIKDALNGLFMVLEDQLGVGDEVDLGHASGVVEEVGVRITKIRDEGGTLWSVRNGEIVRVGNKSHSWARVILDLPLPYDADLDTVQELLLNTANTLSQDAIWRNRILEQPEVLGLESVTPGAVMLRLAMKTRTSARDAVARELRLRIKHDLDEAGIGFPGTK